MLRNNYDNMEVDSSVTLDLQRPLLGGHDDELLEQPNNADASTPSEAELEDGNSYSNRGRTTDPEGDGTSQEDGRSILSILSNIAINGTLVPDKDIVVYGIRLVDGIVVIKLLKFLILTFTSIALVHLVVVRFFPDRDHRLHLWEIWVFEGDMIIRDSVVFFAIGRIWKQPRGVDNIEWIVMMVLANIYFESQGYISWMGHSVTLYEMHCVWPWQLWVFVGTVIPLFATLFFAHLVRAHREGILTIKLIELSLCIGMFLAPIVPSPYFHFHHWFAGWFFGMHANLSDVWWSRMTMAYFWGMYINGIAVYGRDPMLTCEYARFVTSDQNCPAWNREGGGDTNGQSVGEWQVSWDHELLSSGKWIINAVTLFSHGSWGSSDYIYDGLAPADWRNCSSKGYHP
jgi:hypothetical protein